MMYLSGSKLREVIEFIEQDSDSIFCEQMKVGESLNTEVLPTETDDYIENIHKPYVLYQKNENVTQAKINLEFVEGANYSGHSSSHAGSSLNDEFKAKANSCLSEANKHMYDPATGKRLEIVLDSSAPKQEIEIGAHNHRSNSGEYNPNIECSAIVHEVLHLLGLKDSYREEQSGYTMSDAGDLEFHSNLSEAIGVEIKFDQVNGNSVLVKDPSSDKTYSLKSDCRSIGPMFSIMSDNQTTWQRSIDGGRSLLSSAHFNKIVYPGCKTKNYYYDLCTKEDDNGTLKNKPTSGQCLKNTDSFCNDSNFSKYISHGYQNQVEPVPYE